MNDHVHELLSAFIDGELNEEERKKVVDHLAECRQCSNELKELQWLKGELFAAYHSIEIPNVQFEHSVVKKIKKISSPHQPMNRYVRWTMSFIALLMAAFIVFKMGTVFYIGITLAASFVHIGLSVLHALATVLSSIPLLFLACLIISIVILGISIWAIQYLLRVKSLD
ncbi:MAG: zf-HC2 domain-containing protein [Bacillales bacterium]|nr:zf-HC2 domain-containing protein [Bacillales bacterium]